VAAKLPYLSTPGTLTSALDKIRAAATPPTVNGDFVQTKLKMKGGSGRAIPPFLKKIGFVAGDGTPTNLYERFRNSNSEVSGAAAAEAMRYGYKELYEVNEYAHELSDKDLKGLVVQVSGLEETSTVVALVVSTFKKLKAYADFEAEPGVTGEEGEKPTRREGAGGLGGQSREFSIGYTINLNLPASTNVEVFNAIFKSLRENLLDGD
jgi:hypothetical protein